MDYSLLMGVSFCNPGYGSSAVTDKVCSVHAPGS